MLSLEFVDLLIVLPKKELMEILETPFSVFTLNYNSSNVVLIVSDTELKIFKVSSFIQYIQELNRNSKLHNTNQYG